MFSSVAEAPYDTVGSKVSVNARSQIALVRLKNAWNDALFKMFSFSSSDISGFGGSLPPSSPTSRSMLASDSAVESFGGGRCGGDAFGLRSPSALSSLDFTTRSSPVYCVCTPLL